MEGTTGDVVTVRIPICSRDGYSHTIGVVLEQTCPACKGAGKYLDDVDFKPPKMFDPCELCQGEGKYRPDMILEFVAESTVTLNGKRVNREELIASLMVAETATATLTLSEHRYGTCLDGVFTTT